MMIRQSVARRAAQKNETVAVAVDLRNAVLLPRRLGGEGPAASPRTARRHPNQSAVAAVVDPHRGVDPIRKAQSQAATPH